MYDGYNDTRPARNFNDDPWDISRGGGDGARCRSVALKRSLWLVWLALGVGVLLLAWSAQVLAQSAPPRPPDIEKGRGKPTARDRIKVKLKDDAGELAQDYLVLLDQLKTLTADYSTYYSDFQQVHAEELEKKMRKLSHRLNDSAYFRDFTTLTYDLTRLQYELRLQEEKLAKLHKNSHARGVHSGESADPRLRKITRTLRREIEMLHDQFEDDIGERMRVSAAKSAIVQQYIRAAVVSMGADGGVEKRAFVLGKGDQVGHTPIVLEIDLGNFPDLDAVLENCEQIEIHSIIEPPQPSDVYEFPQLTVYAPQFEAPPIRLEDKRTAFRHSSGEAGLSLQFIDSTRINSAATPVYVVNPMGTLEVEGWNRPWISVDAKVELSAVSAEKAEALAERVDVRIHNRSNAVYVELVLPQLTDPRTSILSTTIEIKAPRDNSLSCSNSHGRLVVRDFDNDVKINADHCDIKLSTVDGKVEVVNSMGYLTVSDVSGRLELRNTYGALTVTGCNGDMTIENDLASIDIKDCSGEAQVRNSGRVDVYEFIGDLRIDNDNGAVMVQNLEGSLEVTNSLQPVVVENIRGRAGLQNERGTIQVDQIDGPLSANNNYGSISAVSLSGPLRLVNTNGLIDLVVDEDIIGRSSIIADNGTIKLRLDESSDVLLTVEMIGGAIKSAFSTPVQQTDSSSTTRLELGRMAASLDVSGYGTDIVISTPR
ncbi:MAG: hypothetical protein OEV49_09405 [candidate division Zixibacteria bacterium]|nr:hypothetical protein [candidate division Zixibacteria bacterium]MDH3936527.1 hypothetical protein [candidate division Zixibacteria bacterium]MDH4033958.1 hypothetical protein [candidate division Zixibacteria bacterium]